MKVEDSPDLVVQCFCNKTSTSQEKELSSCRKYIIFHVRNATTIIHFIVTARILTVIRSIFAETAIINLHPNARGRRGQIVGGNIRLARCAVKQAFCTMITSTTPTTVAVIRIAIILSLNGNPLPYRLRPCRSSLVSTISSE